MAKGKCGEEVQNCGGMFVQGKLAPTCKKCKVREET